jgi:hypothetical protein
MSVKGKQFLEQREENMHTNVVVQSLDEVTTGIPTNEG